VVSEFQKTCVRPAKYQTFYLVQKNSLNKYLPVINRVMFSGDDRKVEEQENNTTGAKFFTTRTILHHP